MYKPILTANYNCIDIKCKNRLRIKYTFYKNENKEIIIEKNDMITEHDLPYINYNYIRNTVIKFWLSYKRQGIEKFSFE